MTPQEKSVPQLLKNILMTRIITNKDVTAPYYRTSRLAPPRYKYRVSVNSLNSLTLTLRGYQTNRLKKVYLRVVTRLCFARMHSQKRLSLIWR